MLNKKFIVTSGCSFTNTFIETPPTINFDKPKDNWTWPMWLQQYLGNQKYIVLNMGNQTNDNSSIVNTLLFKVNELLQSGISASDIELLVQWTNPYRMSFYIESDNNNKNECHTLNFVDNDKNGFWYLTGGFRDFHILNEYVPTEFLETYLPFYNNKVNCYTRFFKDVLLLQTFCETKGIKWKSFFMNESLTQNYYQYNKTYDRVDTNISIGEDLILKKNLHTNTHLKNIFEENRNLDFYSSLINLNNFWFYESNDFKYGGMYEWTIRNYNREQLEIYKEDGLQYSMFTETMGKHQLSLNEEIEFVNKNNHRFGHTSSIMVKKFTKEVILNLYT